MGRRVNDWYTFRRGVYGNSNNWLLRLGICGRGIIVYDAKCESVPFSVRIGRKRRMRIGRWFVQLLRRWEPCP
jgi:hypothetical protein